MHHRLGNCVGRLIINLDLYKESIVFGNFGCLPVLFSWTILSTAVINVNAFILEDHSQITQIVQRGMNTSDRMWNKTFSESNVVLPLVLVLGPTKHTKILCPFLKQPISIITVHSAIINCVFPFLSHLEGSTKKLVRPVQSTIVPPLQRSCLSNMLTNKPSDSIGVVTVTDTAPDRLWNFSAPSNDTCTTQWNNKILSRRVRLHSFITGLSVIDAEE